MNEKTSENKEDKIKYQALIDNTAQGIFNYLKEIENKREIYEKRWIWELLQNALDATPQDRKIEIKIIRNNKRKAWGTLLKIVTLHPLVIVVEGFYALASEIRRTWDTSPCDGTGNGRLPDIPEWRAMKGSVAIEGKDIFAFKS